MARASSNPDKAVQGGGGIEPGNYEVTAACFKNHKTEFKATHLALSLSLAVLDNDGKAVRGAEPVELFLGYGNNIGDKFHPGKASNADDDDPKDLGSDEGTEGNTIYAVNPSDTFNKSAGALVFLESLCKLGFPKSILDRSYAPDFVGLKAYVASATSKECNDLLGTRLNTRPMKNNDGTENDVTYKIVKKWLNPTYIKGGSAKSESSKSEKTSAAAPAESGSDDAKELVMEILAEVAKTKGGESNKIKSVAQLVGHFTSAYSKAKKPPKMLTACQSLIKSGDFEEILGEVGGYMDDGAIVLPEAA